MTASLSVIAAGGRTAPACVPDSSSLCARVWDVTGQAWLAGNAEALVATPARILLVVVVAVVARALVHRGIGRLTDRTATGSVPGVLRPLRARVPQQRDGEHVLARRSQRAAAIGSALC